VVADRFFPSSKLCSGCGAIKPALDLGEHTYDCDACGLSLDRDQNAAINLRAYGLRELGIDPLPVDHRKVTPVETTALASLAINEVKRSSAKQEATASGNAVSRRSTLETRR
jgi:putative transposase